MYAAGVAGGVWKTINGGASWPPLGDFLANIAVSSLALSPKNPSVLYAGTGEGYFNGDAIRGAGIFKTTDGGATWTRLAATTGSDFYYVNKIVVSKQSSGPDLCGHPDRRLALAQFRRHLDAGARSPDLRRLPRPRHPHRQDRGRRLRLLRHVRAGHGLPQS